MEFREVASGYKGGDVEVQINHLKAQIEELKVVTRLQKVGRFSGRHREQDCKKKCNKCPYSCIRVPRQLAQLRVFMIPFLLNRGITKSRF